MLAVQDDARFWDRFARRYSRAKISDMAGYERTLERTTELISGMPAVLEIGCGTGTTALRLAPFVGHMRATDISSGMIGIAKDKAVDAGCPNIEFDVAAPEDVVAGEGTYDAVLAFNLLHLLRDRAATLAHVRQLLKPGGLLISKTVCLTELNPLIRIAIPVMQWVKLAPYVSVIPAERLEQDVIDAGFTIIERARHGSTKKDIRAFIVARR